MMDVISNHEFEDPKVDEDDVDVDDGYPYGDTDNDPSYFENENEDVDNFGVGMADDNTENDNYGSVDTDTSLDDYEIDLAKQAISPNIPESELLDTKVYATNSLLRNGDSMRTDLFGTGEMFDDESSAAALLAVMGFLLVLFVGGCVYVSFRQTMGVTPTNSKSSSKQGSFKAFTSSFSKRQE